MWLYGCIIVHYRPQTKLRKGNVFTPVCQSFCSQGKGCVSQHALGQTTPAVVDLGFPQGGGTNSPGGAYIRFCQIFPKTAYNWKNLDPGGVCPSHPLRSATALDRHLLGRHPQGRHPQGRHPLGRHTPYPVHAVIHTPLPSACWDTPPLSSHCCGQYTSYWNAYLFSAWAIKRFTAIFLPSSGNSC